MAPRSMARRSPPSAAAGARPPCSRWRGSPTRTRGAPATVFEMARLANEHPPRLKTFDAKGRRSDTVEFHPAYHHFMAESIEAGLHAPTLLPAAVRGAGPRRVG